MASAYREAKFTDFMTYLPAVSDHARARYEEVYEENHHRVYSLAFWMTDNELNAEELMAATFGRGTWLNTLR